MVDSKFERGSLGWGGDEVEATMVWDGVLVFEKVGVNQWTEASVRHCASLLALDNK